VQVRALSTWPCLLCGNPLAPTGCLEGAGPELRSVLRRARWFALHGVTVHRVLTDNGIGYRSRLFGAALADTGVRH
jgi:hypothetical protein